MIILGVKYPGHDSAAALVVDGKIIAASAQERFDRIKHSKAFPADAIKWCLGFSSISINDIDAIAVQYDFSMAYRRYIPQLGKQYGTKSLKPIFQNLRDDFIKHLSCYYWLKYRMGYRGPIFYLDHHNCHAASAFYTSPFEESAIMTVDGRGEKSTTRLYIAKSAGLKQLCSIEFPHSLGLLYSKITSFLGFKSDRDEGTVMGLSAYGDNRFLVNIKELIELGPEFNFKLNLDYFDYHLDMNKDVSNRFIIEFGPRRSLKDVITENHKAVSKAIQCCLEDSLEYLGHKAYEITGSSNLCMAGGTALNAVANGKLHFKLPFKNIYVQPASGDDGSALGAALLLYYKLVKKQYIPQQYWDPYLGYEANHIEIRSAIESIRKYFKRLNNPEKFAAWLLSKGYIIGWYQGRAEFGPRALGNRSILSSATTTKVKERLDRIKKRESFRPFAPAILLSDMPTYFDSWRSSPYMTFAFSVREHKKKCIPAVVHVDSTARVQTVEECQNNKLYKLINHYRDLTGKGIVLNTSFNSQNEPIVNTPKEALNVFIKNGLDAVFLNEYVVFSSRLDEYQ